MRIIPLAAVGLALAIGSMAALASAQPAETVYHIGVLGLPADNPFIAAFRQDLQDRGYSEGRNIRFTYRTYGGTLLDSARLAAYTGMANDLVRLKVDVILAPGPPHARAAKAATATIPIVFLGDEDSVAHGFISSLARPGGNLTGFTMVGKGFTEKQLELLKEMVPRAKRMAILVAPATRLEHYVGDSRAAADRLGVRLQVFEARTAEDIDRLFAAATAKNTRIDALHVHGMAFLEQHQERILAAAKTRRLPAMYWHAGWVRAGGLMSFGANFIDLGRRMAELVDKILKGARPADLPVEEPTKYFLAINMRTARELGLTVPQSLLQRADRVIE